MHARVVPLQVQLRIKVLLAQRTTHLRPVVDEAHVLPQIGHVRVEAGAHRTRMRVQTVGLLLRRLRPRRRTAALVVVATAAGVVVIIIITAVMTLRRCCGSRWRCFLQLGRRLGSVQHSTAHLRLGRGGARRCTRGGGLP